MFLPSFLLLSFFLSFFLNMTKLLRRGAFTQSYKTVIQQESQFPLEKLGRTENLVGLSWWPPLPLMLRNLQHCNTKILVQLHHPLRQVHKQATKKKNKLHTIVLYYCRTDAPGQRSAQGQMIELGLAAVRGPGQRCYLSQTTKVLQPPLVGWFMGATVTSWKLSL